MRGRTARGVLTLELRHVGGRAELRVADDGVGYEEGGLKGPRHPPNPFARQRGGRRDEDCRAARRGHRRGRQAVVSGMQSRPAVLLVEDEAVIRELLATDFEGAGFEVHDAASADEAITLLDGLLVGVCATFSYRDNCTRAEKWTSFVVRLLRSRQVAKARTEP